MSIVSQENSLLDGSDGESLNLSEKQTPIGVHQDDVIHNALSTSTVSRCNEPLKEEKSLPTVKKSQQELRKKQSTRFNKQNSDVQNRMLELEEEKLKIFKQWRVETDE